MKTIKTTKAKTPATASKPTPAKPAAAKAPAAKALDAAPARKRSVKIATPKVAKEPVAPTTPAATPLSKPRREITTELIAARAYLIWEQQGRPQGNELSNWLLAESQLKEEIQSFTA